MTKITMLGIIPAYTKNVLQLPSNLVDVTTLNLEVIWIYLFRGNLIIKTM